jgi:chromosome segregation ATPase
LDPQKLEEQISQLREEHSDLKKRINVNIELMYDKTEKWHQELLMKKETLQQNKVSIEETIKGLDIEKNKDIQNTVKEVDTNLQNIFSVLLNNAGASLKPEYKTTGNE